MDGKILKKEPMKEQSVESYKYPSLDPTTPWYEFLSYQECCWSLNVPVSLHRFMRYNAYLKSVGIQ